MVSDIFGRPWYLINSTLLYRQNKKATSSGFSGILLEQIQDAWVDTLIRIGTKEWIQVCIVWL